MTNLRRTNIGFADSAAIDAFGLLRTTGGPSLLLDSKRVGGVPDNFHTTLTTGSGTIQYVQNEASTLLTVGTAAGRAVRQTKVRAVYQPGKSERLLQTFVLAPTEANLAQEVGLFDDNNGVFLRLANNDASVVVRSSVTGSPVDTTVLRSGWDDPLNSQLNLADANILEIDIEWLGVGRVRYGFVLNGLLIYAHEQNHASAGLQQVYMSNPNLPIRWEIRATDTISGTRSLRAICGSVDSEGGYARTGVTASADMGVTGRQVAGGTIGEILAVRTQAPFTEFSTAIMQSVSLLASTSSNFLWRLVYNPTETAAGTWNPITGTIMEQNTGRTVTPDTGIRIASGYVSGDVNSVDVVENPVLTFGTELDGTTDVFSLQVGNLSGGNETYLGAMTWREIY